MKKTCLSLAVSLLLLLITACDPSFSQDYYFKNMSGHDVTLVTLIDTADTYYTPFYSDTISVSYFENPNGITIHDGEERLLHSECGLGVAGIGGTTDVLRHFIYGDSVRFVFDDGRYLEYKWNMLLEENNPYDDGSYHCRVNDDRSYGCCTYTLKPDDYERAAQP